MASVVLGKPRDTAELTKERLRRAGNKICEQFKGTPKEPEDVKRTGTLFDVGAPNSQLAPNGDVAWASAHVAEGDAITRGLKPTLRHAPSNSPPKKTL